MNKSSFILGLLLVSPAVLAAPFVVSDPLDPAATHCGWSMDAGTRADAPVAMSGTNKICKLDLAHLSGGSHTVSATAVALDAVWGRRESVPSALFTFAVPTIPAAPVGLGLQK